MNDRPESPTNGTGAGGPSTVSPVPSSDCALAELPPKIHAHIHAMEQRIIQLEAEQLRFMNALKYAGAMLFENPAMKMFASAFPKEVKAKLQEFFSNAVTEKTP